MGEHGKASTYQHDGCRCEACRAANSEHVRRYRKAKPNRAAALSTRQSTRNLLAAQWVRRFRPDVWEQITEEPRNRVPDREDDRG